jgi:hypothetical protein
VLHSDYNSKHEQLSSGPSSYRNVSISQEYMHGHTEYIIFGYASAVFSQRKSAVPISCCFGGVFVFLCNFHSHVVTLPDHGQQACPSRTEAGTPFYRLEPFQSRSNPTGDLAFVGPRLFGIFTDAMLARIEGLSNRTGCMS